MKHTDKAIYPLIATRLADGLGPEILGPTAKSGFAPNNWFPRSSGSVPEDSPNSRIRCRLSGGNVILSAWMSIEKKKDGPICHKPKTMIKVTNLFKALFACRKG
jgi:hypothetical protein